MNMRCTTSVVEEGKKSIIFKSGNKFHWKIVFVSNRCLSRLSRKALNVYVKYNNGGDKLNPFFNFHSIYFSFSKQTIK